MAGAYSQADDFSVKKASLTQLQDWVEAASEVNFHLFVRTPDTSESAQAAIDADGALVLNKLAGFWTQSDTNAATSAQLLSVCTAFTLKLAAVSPRERLLDALSALHEGTSCNRALWLAMAVRCAARVVRMADSDRGRRRAAAACESLARAASLLGSPPELLTSNTAPTQAASASALPAPAPVALCPWADVVLRAASDLHSAAQAAGMPLGQLAACLAAEDAAYASDAAASAQALAGIADSATAVQRCRDVLQAWRAAQGAGDDGDGPLSFPALPALALWRWQSAPGAHGRGVMHGVTMLQQALPAMGAWVHTHPQQHSGVVVHRMVRSIASALGGLAGGAARHGTASTWPTYTDGPWLTLDGCVDMHEDVKLEHSREPAAAVLRLLLSHMSLGSDEGGRQMAWGGLRELLARHTPVARLWLMRVALQALPQADVAALLWDGVRHFCATEARAPLPGGQAGFQSPALKALVLDMQERRSAAAWPEGDVGVVERAPVHTAFMSTLRLLCLRAAHKREGGAPWGDADPSAVARYCACSKTFDTSYMQFLRSETAKALQEKGIGSTGGAALDAAGGLQGAEQLPKLAAGGELPNAPVASSSKQDVGLLLQLEGALVQLAEELERVRNLTAAAPAAERLAWAARAAAQHASQRPSAASPW